MKTKRLCLPVAAVCFGLLASAVGSPRRPFPDRAAFEKAVAELNAPPAWFDSVDVSYDTSAPWKKARLDIRKMLGRGDQESRRRAIKLTCLYRDKGDIGDGHELPMYIYLGREFLWAVKEYRSLLARLVKEDKPGFAHAALDLAACYRHFGQYDQGIDVVRESMERAPKPPWDVAHLAHAQSVLGDLYAETGDFSQARLAYARAAALYPTSKQPWGRQKLPIRAAMCRAKARMLSLPSFGELGLHDGVFVGQSEGYVGPVRVTMTIAGGKATDMQLQHKENITQGVETIMPQRILDAQSLQVDAVTGATTTGDAIRHACLEALRKAGAE